jgi:hypothetical protein
MGGHQRSWLRGDRHRHGGSTRQTG